MGSGKFVTTINCMDGRVQELTNNYMKKSFQADYVDVITLAGPSEVIALGEKKSLIENLKFRLDISVGSHKSDAISVCGHDDCGGVPNANVEEHKKLIIKACEEVKNWNYGVPIIGLWIGNNFNKVEKIY